MTDEVIPLSNIEVIDKLKKYGHEVKYVPYNEIKYIEDINEILPCLILYQLNYPVGHWVVLFRNRDGINYFDSTGHVPDELLKTSFHHMGGRKALNADYTYLLDLLAKTGKKIIYNEQPLQYPSTTNTCGYWSFVRLLTQDISNDIFNKVWMIYSPEERQKKIVRLYQML